ncbi:hypothetical protein HZA87_05375 [Candidatus Uhrbacteria bacterium]|nr:hypothetical protein [Candidatus Uhrbacteria bacterium]
MVGGTNEATVVVDDETLRIAEEVEEVDVGAEVKDDEVVLALAQEEGDKERDLAMLEAA